MCVRVNQVSRAREDGEDNQLVLLFWCACDYCDIHFLRDQLVQMDCQGQLEFLAIVAPLDSQENLVT